MAGINATNSTKKSLWSPKTKNSKNMGDQAKFFRLALNAKIRTTGGLSKFFHLFSQDKKFEQQGDQIKFFHLFPQGKNF